MTITILVSDITADDTRAAGWWASTDGQGSLDMRGTTLAGAKAELLAQCGTEGLARTGILAGSIEIAAAGGGDAE